jgi:hypothetical protein
VSRERTESILILRKPNEDLGCSSAKSQFARSLIQETGRKQARIHTVRRGVAASAVLHLRGQTHASFASPGRATHALERPWATRTHSLFPQPVLQSQPCRTVCFYVHTMCKHQAPFSETRPDLADHIGLWCWGQLSTHAIMNRLNSA